MESIRYIMRNEGKYVRWIHHVANNYPNTLSYAENDDQVMILSDEYLDYKANKRGRRKDLLLDKFPNMIFEKVIITNLK